jgi:hypothetical protein
MMTNIENESDFLFYRGNDGTLKVQVILGDQTVWLSQKSMGDVFGVDRSAITKHLQNIFASNELNENSVSAKIAQTASDGKTYNISFYNLDAIIAIGYRVNSYQATQFRIWASGILKEFLIKGFVMDDDRLKQGKKLFDRDYFDELLERIREIRASERRFYQKITDIYAQCSIDYDSQSPVTQGFFATVQNKLEFAITQKTASELVKSRANFMQPNMGLNTWRNAPHGKILKTDICVAKNYLQKEEIAELNIIVNMYLDYAELQAKRNKTMKMADWIEKMDAFLKFNDYHILQNYGTVSAKLAKQFAEKQFEKFRVIQDQNFESDFDRVSSTIVHNREIPKEPAIIPNKTISPTQIPSLKGLENSLAQILKIPTTKNKG